MSIHLALSIINHHKHEYKFTVTWFCWVILTRPSSFLGPKIHAKWGYLHDLPIEAAERNDCVTTSAAHRRLEKSSENMVNLVAPNLKQADHVFFPISFHGFSSF